MSRSLILTVFVVLNLILMVYTILKIRKIKDFKKINKTALIYITIVVPVLGFILMLNEIRK